MINIYKPVLLRFDLKVCPLTPFISRLGFEDFLKLLDSLLRGTVWSVLVLTLVIAADAAPVGKQYPEIFVLLFPDLTDFIKKKHR